MPLSVTYVLNLFVTHVLNLYLFIFIFLSISAHHRPPGPCSTATMHEKPYPMRLFG